MAQITIDNLNVTVVSKPGQSILNSLLIEEQPIHTVCGGKARCGCCRIQILAGKRGLTPVNEHETIRLGPDSLAKNWRLACQTHILRDITIHLPIAEELESACSKKK